MVGSVPTAAERGGDFSQALTTTPVTIFDPLSGSPFPNNVIPTSRFDSASAGLLQYFPNPTYPGIVQNYRFVITDPSTSRNIGVRFNAPLNNKDRLNFNFQKQNQNSNSHQLFGFLDTGSSSGLSFSTGWSHSFRPRINNSANFTISRSRSLNQPFFAYTQNIAAELGITGTSQDPINYGPPGLSFTNFSSLSDGTPNLSRNQTATFSDNFTYVVKRRHNLTFGFTYNRLQQNSENYQNARGSFSFSGLFTSQLDSDGQPVKGTGYDFADFLLGLPQSSSLRFGSSNNYFRSWSTSAYAQDDFRASARLTINVGLRYEYFAPYTELRGHLANLDVSPGFTAVAVVTSGENGPYSGALPSSIVRSRPKDFSPRLGIAWRPFAEAEHADPQRLQHLLQRIFVRADCQPDGRAAAVCHLGLANHQPDGAADIAERIRRFADHADQHLRDRPELPHRLRADLEREHTAHAASRTGGGYGVHRHQGDAPGDRGESQSLDQFDCASGVADQQRDQLHLSDAGRQFALRGGAGAGDAAALALRIGEHAVHILQGDRRRVHLQRHGRDGGAVPG